MVVGLVPRKILDPVINNYKGLTHIFKQKLQQCHQFQYLMTSEHMVSIQKSQDLRLVHYDKKELDEARKRMSESRE